MGMAPWGHIARPGSHCATDLKYTAKLLFFTFLLHNVIMYIYITQRSCLCFNGSMLQTCRTINVQEDSTDIC